MSTGEIMLAGSHAQVRVLPGSGSRIQSVLDRVTGRELLHQRAPDGAAAEFLAASTGGWDEMFPNDAPWNRFPDHGVLWSAPFEVLDLDDHYAILEATLERPHITVRRRVALLESPRRGVRVELGVQAHVASGPFLWASHPMLSVEPGWEVDAGNGELRADRELCGRHPPDATLAGIPPVPARGEGWSEVVYAPGRSTANVISPDRERGTRLSWDGEKLPWLWVVTVTGEAGLDLCTLLEPATAGAWRMETVIANGMAHELAAGATRRWWLELESADRVRVR
jgi:hypothetical protein